ncbi:MAG: DUF937 domain-containing protein [Pirellulaceae bacterium]
MSGLLDLVSQHIGAEQVDAIANKLGASREQTESAIGMALPTLLGAVARKADNDQGAEELHQQLQQQDDSLIDQLGSLLGGGASSSNAGVQAFGGAGDLLGSILGGRQSKVEQGIGKASGLSGGQVGSLLSMLAPMIMGTLSKKSRSDQMDAGGLAGMLRSEKKTMENQASGGLLAGLLDQDGDGDFDFQDIMKLGMKRLFNR